MDESPSRTALVVFIVLVLAVAAGLATLVYEETKPTPASSGRLVAAGDNVTVNYVGYFGSGPQSGRVFDTSLLSVASNNASYPKSLEYQPRNGTKAYSPLAVHVGTAPASGYSVGNLTFVGVVTGFWKGLLGLSGNETRSIVVPPALGYGPSSPSCFRTLPLAYEVPTSQTFSVATFTSVYPGISATVGAVFNDPHYGWNATIFSANNSFVTVLNQPYAGYVAHPAGWPVLVNGIVTAPNGTVEIALTNQLAPSDAEHRLGHDFNASGPCSSQNGGRFIVSAVNPLNGTYSEDFNPEVKGQTLIFVVTVVDILLPVV